MIRVLSFFIEWLIVTPMHLILVMTVPFSRWITSYLMGGWAFENITRIRKSLNHSPAKKGGVLFHYVPGDLTQKPTDVFTNRRAWPNGVLVTVTIRGTYPSIQYGHVVGIGCLNSWGRLLVKRLDIQDAGTYVFLLGAGHEPWQVGIIAQTNAGQVQVQVSPQLVDRASIRAQYAGQPNFYDL
jgi:hypothetical protein